MITHPNVQAARPPHVTESPAPETSANGYFQQLRLDIARLLPPHAARIADVGAGAGRTTAWMKQHYAPCQTVALEGNPAMASYLASNADEIHLVDLEEPLPDIGRPDLILCLDVLEHLKNPVDVLIQLTARLAAGGTVIVSCPNVAHLSVSLPLLLLGRFDYAESGILDRTHLRFFTRSLAVSLMNDAGLIVHGGVRSGLENPRARLLDGLTGGLLRDRLTRQYVLAGHRAAAGERQAVIAWSLPG